VIEHFLQDIQRPAEKRGFCDFGIQVQHMEGEGLRRSMGMSKGQSGLLLNKVAPLVGAAKVLQRDDVLIAIEGNPIGNDGTVAFRDGERVSFRYQLLEKFVGDRITVTILRKGVTMDVEIELAKYPYLVPVQQHDVVPSYFIFAGFVFQVLTQPYLANEWGKEWKKKAPIKFVDHHLYHLKEFQEQELVVCSQILVNDMNVGYSACAPAILTAFNGESVKNLKHLVEMVEEVEKNAQEYCPDGADEADQSQRALDFLRFEFENGMSAVINTQEALESNLEILKQQNIPFNKSSDLQLTKL